MDRNVCAGSADYSQITDLARVLPFLFELDMEASNLYPAAGERQRFCYIVTARGEDTSRYADLSHFVLGACDTLTLQDISDVTVTINGVPQQVTLGGNVQWRTQEAPDPPTGCAGLKFDFPLNKVMGLMRVCFSLAREFPIGAMPICLYGGGVTASGLTICGPVCREDGVCAAVGYQRASVCVPVRVTPRVVLGEPTAYCCGAPTVSPGATACPGIPRGSCAFTLTQTICVAVPAYFTATAVAGDPSVSCGSASDETCVGCVPAAPPVLARTTCRCLP